MNVHQELQKDNSMKILCSCMLVLAFISCGEHKPTSCDAVHIDLSGSVGDSLFVSDWIEPLEIIALETTEESLLGSVDKLVECDGKYYVLDRMRKCILLFAENGKFLRSIGRVGQGPGEYPDLYDFVVDVNTGRLYLLTEASVIYAYNGDGRFLWKKKISNSLLWNIGCNGDGFVCSSNHLTYTSGEDAYLIYRFDASFQEQDRSVKVFEKQVSSPLLISAPFQKWNGVSCYVDSRSNVVYSLHDEEVMPSLKLGFTSPMPIEYFADAGLFMVNQQNYDFLMETFFSGNFMWVSYIHGGGHYTAIVELTGNRVVANGKTIGVLPKVYQSGEYLLSPVSAEEYLKSCEHLDNLQKRTVTFDDNHLILKWKVRNK